MRTGIKLYLERQFKRNPYTITQVLINLNRVLAHTPGMSNGISTALENVIQVHDLHPISVTPSSKFS